MNKQRPIYPFRRFVYMFAIGWLIGGGVAGIIYNGEYTWAIIDFAIAAIAIIYRLYHPDMFLRK